MEFSLFFLVHGVLQPFVCFRCRFFLHMTLAAKERQNSIHIGHIWQLIALVFDTKMSLTP